MILSAFHSSTPFRPSLPWNLMMCGGACDGGDVLPAALAASFAPFSGFAEEMEMICVGYGRSTEPIIPVRVSQTSNRMRAVSGFGTNEIVCEIPCAFTV